jgi:tryptophan synthase alpha chain
MPGFAGMFERVATENRAALLPYLMAGIPDPEVSVGLFEAMAQAGADGFEVGLPYADPLMDGPVIQSAGARALARGTTLEVGLGVLRRVAAVTELPCAVMTYANPVFRVGELEFCRRIADAGADALIVADLPVDEAGTLSAAAAEAGVGLVLFAAPTTPEERLRRVADARPPFVYGIAELGVTGERSATSSRAADLVARLRAVTDLPVVLGVGISGPEAAARAAAVADGVIVGSAVVRRVLESPDAATAAARVGEFVGELAGAVRR